MKVAELWRHPVKSLQGERLVESAVEPGGLAGDRSWGIVDTATGKVLTGRREPPLLMAASRLTAGGEPAIDLPDGTALMGLGPTVDSALSRWLGRPVVLAAAAEVEAGQAEYFADAVDDSSEVLEFTMPAGRFVDALPLLVLSTTSLRAAAEHHPDGVWDVRRFRPNVLVELDDGESTEGWVEDGWVGRVLRVGTAEIQVAAPCVRCTMVTRPQPGLERDLDVFRTLAREKGGTFGVWAGVLTPGTVRVGDPVELLDR